MPAFFSGRDTATIDGQSESDWLVSLVINCKREREARLDLYRPLRMYMDKLDIEITGAEEYQVPADIAEEVARKVKRPAVPVYDYGMGYGKHGRQYTGGINLHRYCPYNTTGESECYYPNGKGEDCTSKAFKKKHGANPFVPTVPESIEGDYTREQLIAITKTLEGQIAEYENRGQGDSAECLELSEELVEMYYQLAEVEPSEAVAESIRAEARQIENCVYEMETPLL